MESNQSSVRQNPFRTRTPSRRLFNTFTKPLTCFLILLFILEDNNEAYFSNIVSVYEIHSNFIHSLLNIRGREEFCSARETNMCPLITRKIPTFIVTLYVKRQDCQLIDSRVALSQCWCSLCQKLHSDVANRPYHYRLEQF